MLIKCRAIFSVTSREVWHCCSIAQSPHSWSWAGQLAPFWPKVGRSLQTCGIQIGSVGESEDVSKRVCLSVGFILVLDRPPVQGVPCLMHKLQKTSSPLTPGKQRSLSIFEYCDYFITLFNFWDPVYFKYYWSNKKKSSFFFLPG